MARVLRRPQAAEDIAEVWDYIADDSLDAADHWVDQLDEAFRLLASQPRMAGREKSLRPGSAASRSDATSFSTSQLTTASTWCASCTRHATLMKCSANDGAQRGRHGRAEPAAGVEGVFRGGRYRTLIVLERPAFPFAL